MQAYICDGAAQLNLDPLGTLGRTLRQLTYTRSGRESFETMKSSSRLTILVLTGLGLIWGLQAIYKAREKAQILAKPTFMEIGNQEGLRGKPAAPFRLPVIDSGDGRAERISHVSLSDLRGRPVVLNVWSTWCPGCAEEYAMFRDSARANKSVQFVAILWQDTRRNAESFVSEKGRPGFVLLDGGGSRFGMDYMVMGVPQTYFIDKNGIIVRVLFGSPRSQGDLQAAIGRFLLVPEKTRA